MRTSGVCVRTKTVVLARSVFIFLTRFNDHTVIGLDPGAHKMGS